MKERMEPLIIIQARLESVRLPRKALLPIAGKPMLQHVIERCKLTGFPVWVATGTGCDAIETLCETLRVPCHRGEHHDVLSRLYECLEQAGGYTHIIRVTGDCPMADPALILKLVETYEDDHLYAISTGVGAKGFPCFPDGLDAELISRAALKDAYLRASSVQDREHVTPWIIRHRDVRRLYPKEDYSHVKWSIDTEEEYRQIRTLIEGLPEGYSWRDAL